MIRVFKSLSALALLALTLAACSSLEGDGRHLVPLSSAAEARLAGMNSSPQAAMLVRIFKEESALEVWKETASGQFELFKTYEVCAWSGDLGPKIAEGDRQSPEGFSTITAGLLNPRSEFHLSFNTGFPNKYDRAYGRTGSNLMVHGDCSSRGCFAMTDEQIAEIYALARESFAGGNRSFQLQVYPFRMTPENMARHRFSEHMPFWRNLKEGYDHFEVTRRPVEWDVCGREYVFNVENPTGRVLDASAACPADISVQPQLMALVANKQASDEAAFNAAVAQIEAAEADAEARAQEQERVEMAAAVRGAAMDQAVAGVETKVTTFIGGLLGRNAPQAQPPANQTPIPEAAPAVPAAAQTAKQPLPAGAPQASEPPVSNDPFANFFAGLFGGGRAPAAQPADAQPGGVAPVPAPRISDADR